MNTWYNEEWISNIPENQVKTFFLEAVESNFFEYDNENKKSEEKLFRNFILRPCLKSYEEAIDILTGKKPNEFLYLYSTCMNFNIASLLKKNVNSASDDYYSAVTVPEFLMEYTLAGINRKIDFVSLYDNKYNLIKTIDLHTQKEL